ncbi:unnamed protein product, partial [Discosporangium mesarthrocarpum]
DSVGALLNQSPGYGVSWRRTGSGRGGSTPVKDYRRDNRAAIKEIQAQVQARREQEAAPPAEPFKLEQFKSVKSRFSSPQGSKEDCPDGPSASKHEYLRRGSRDKVAAEQRKEAVRIGAGEGGRAGENGGASPSRRLTTPRKEPVPKACEVKELAPRTSRDFVSANRIKVGTNSERRE